MNVTIHEHEIDGWVLRLHHDGNTRSIGALNGKEEAEVVQAVLQGAIELHGGANIDDSDAFWKGMRNADRIVEGKRLLDYMNVKC